MIIIINGPLGIGKSETAWELLGRFPHAVMLDLDHIAAFTPFDYYNQAHLDYAYATCAVLVEHHYAHGIEDFILNWVFESAEQLERLKRPLLRLNLPIFTYRLTCDPETIAQRIQQRNRSDVSFELDRARELVKILDHAAQQGDLGAVIDTTQLTTAQTADYIWNELHQSPQS